MSGSASSASTSALDAFEDALFRGLRPEPALTVAEWADRHRWLSSRGASEPGPWRTSRTPFLRAIMEDLSASTAISRVVFMKGTQIGGTECGLNWAGYVIHHAPGPMLIVMPTVETAKRNSKQRIGPLIEESPALSERVRKSRSRDSGNTLFAKEFPGGVLVLTGANSAVGLRSMPVRFLFLDEIDTYPGDVDEEGDPVALAEARTRTFARRKIFLVSSPTIKGLSRIEREYEASDRRRYYVPCPVCDHFQVLRFAQLRWPAGEPRRARYHCEACDASLGDEHKTEMLACGEWRAEAPGEGKAHGYHLSGLYSPVGWLSWVEIAEAWTAAQGDPEALKTFINTMLGETWDDQGIRVDEHALLTRRESWTGIPPGVLVLTAGVDVQDDRLEYEIVGWGVDEESWSIAKGAIYGDPSAPEVWNELDDLLGEERRDAWGVPLKVRASAVDSGGHYTQAVYNYGRSRLRKGVRVVKGADGPGRPVWPRLASRSNKGRVPLFLLGVDAAKETLYTRLRIEQPGRGYCHFNTDWEEADFAQLTAETLVRKKLRGRPKREWHLKKGRRNERLDCRVYAYAALVGLKVNWPHEQQRRRRQAVVAGVTIEDAPPPRPVPPAPPVAQAAPPPEPDPPPPAAPPAAAPAARPAFRPRVARSSLAMRLR